MEIERERPIFIVGCERSGTTLLRLMLHAHPNIALPPQTKFLKKLYKRRLFWGNLSKEKNKNKLGQWFMDNFNKRTKLIDVGINPKEVKKGILKSPPTFGSAMSVVFKIYSKKYGKSRWGDKRPYYIKYLPQLLSLFPKAQIIHIIRDGRDCLASLSRMPWWKKDIGYSILNWREAVHNGTKAKKELSSHQYFELRYEDFIENPVEWIKKVCDFLEEEYTPTMFQYQKLSEVAVPEYKMLWHADTREKISSKAIGRWKNDLTTWEIYLFEKIAGKELIQRGYELSGIKTTIPLPIWIKFFRSYIQYNFLKYFMITMDHFIDFIYPWSMEYLSSLEPD